jgi:hypothetical protein
MEYVKQIAESSCTWPITLFTDELYLTHEDMTNLIEFLSSNPDLKALRVNGHGLDESAFKGIGQLTHLESLRIGENEITMSVIDELAKLHSLRFWRWLVLKSKTERTLNS